MAGEIKRQAVGCQLSGCPLVSRAVVPGGIGQADEGGAGAGYWREVERRADGPSTSGFPLVFHVSIQAFVFRGTGSQQAGC